MHGERFHYFDTGIKRLIIELELSDVCVFLVHLSLKYRHRQYQLRSLHDLIRQSAKPVIVAGDFNTFWGTHEIYLFMRAAGLRSANTAGLPSFPARIPRIELDFILVSEGIEVTDFRVPDVRFSDHRPLVCDFRVQRRRHRAARLGRLIPPTPESTAAMNDTAPAWKLERDAEGIAWLTLDKPDTSANVLSASGAASSSTSCSRALERDPAARRWSVSAQEERFHRRRRHHANSPASATRPPATS